MGLDSLVSLADPIVFGLTLLMRVRRSIILKTSPLVAGDFLLVHAFPLEFADPRKITFARR